MKWLLSFCGAIGILFAGGFAWAGPKGKPSNYVKSAQIFSTVKNNLNTKISHVVPDASLNQYLKGLTIPKFKDDINWMFHELRNQYYKPEKTPGPTITSSAPAVQKETVPPKKHYATDIRLYVEKPKMPDFEPITLDEIVDSDEMDEYYVPDEIEMSDEDRMASLRTALAGNVSSRNYVLAKTQRFLLLYPFEKRTFEEIYEYSYVLFSQRPEAILTPDEKFLPLDTRLQIQIPQQANFYFNILPYDFIILTSNFIETEYLGQSVSYYALVLSTPGIPLYQKIRALTMLSFLCQPGDTIDDMPMGDVILDSLRNDFKDPPWTVDYAAGMALLNLKHPERFQELIDWRMQLEEKKERTQHERTPGIAWLYNNIFGEYDFFVEKLADIPRFKPDSKEEMEIAMQHLEEIQSHIHEGGAEELMWKLSSLEDLVDFLQLRGCIPLPEAFEEEDGIVPEDEPQE